MSSRHEQKRHARERREAQEREAARAAQRRRRTWLLAAVVALVASVAVPVALLAGGGADDAGPSITAGDIPPRRTTDLGDAARLAGAERIRHDYDFGINRHTDDPVAYPTNPPTNGPHAFSWTADGNYAGLEAPPTGEVVHAQEHGRIVFQYRRGLPLEQVRRLVALYAEDPTKVLLVENATNMPCDVAATAWGRGLLCPRLTTESFDALRAFRDAYRDKGPEVV